MFCHFFVFGFLPFSLFNLVSLLKKLVCFYSCIFHGFRYQNYVHGTFLLFCTCSSFPRFFSFLLLGFSIIDFFLFSFRNVCPSWLSQVIPFFLTFFLCVCLFLFTLFPFSALHPMSIFSFCPWSVVTSLLSCASFWSLVGTQRGACIWWHCVDMLWTTGSGMQSTASFRRLDEVSCGRLQRQRGSWRRFAM